jgi:hypothetical protein
MLLRLQIEFFDKIEQKMRDGDGDGDGRRWDADKIGIFTVSHSWLINRVIANGTKLKRYLKLLKKLYLDKKMIIL